MKFPQVTMPTPYVFHDFSASHSTYIERGVVQCDGNMTLFLTMTWLVKYFLQQNDERHDLIRNIWNDYIPYTGKIVFAWNRGARVLCTNIHNVQCSPGKKSSPTVVAGWAEEWFWHNSTSLDTNFPQPRIKVPRITTNTARIDVIYNQQRPTRYYISCKWTDRMSVENDEVNMEDSVMLDYDHVWNRRKRMKKKRSTKIAEQVCYTRKKQYVRVSVA